MGKLIYNPFQGETAERLDILNTFMVEDDNNNLKYIIYKLKKILNDGRIVEFYKASAFFRLERVPKEAKTNKRFLEVHTDIIRATYVTNISTVEIIANILKPEPIGLIILYGVQATGSTVDEAKHNCASCYQGYLKNFQGTHRLAHIAPITSSLFKQIFDKISDQKYTTVLKGLPSQRTASGANKNVVNFDTETEEQVEQFLAGSTNTEFCFMLMTTPINQNYLNHWLAKSLETQTKWERQKQGTSSLGLNVGIPMSISMNNSFGTTSNTSNGRSSGTTESLSNTTGDSKTYGQTSGVNENHSTSENESNSSGTNISHSDGNSYTESMNESDTNGSAIGNSWNDTHTESRGSGHNVGGGFAGVQVGGNNSKGHSDANSTGGSETFNDSHTEGKTDSYGYTSNDGYGSSETQTKGTGKTDSYGSSDSRSLSAGTSNSQTSASGRSAGTNSSVSKGVNTTTSNGFNTGLNVGFNISKSYQWIDKNVEYICACLDMQNKRLEQMLEGNGGFFTDVYISTDTEENLKGLETLAASTWVNPNAKIDVLRLETPSRIGQKNILQHMKAISPCLEVVKEDGGNGFYYKYSSILTANEITAYTHLPRISIGGLDNAMEDLPLFRCPTNKQHNEIFIGNLVNSEVYSYENALKNGNGYVTDYKYSFSNAEMHHAFFSGASRSGKSVLATRATLEMYKNALYTNKKTKKTTHKRLFVLDPKGEWRQMANLIPKGKFKFYSVGKPYFHPLKLNLLRVPNYVVPYNYFNLVVEHFCSAYGLLDRAIAQISSVIYELYEKNDVFGHEDDPFWANEHSKNITLEDVYVAIEKKLREAEARHNNHDAEALQTYLTRLDMYHRKHSNEYIMFCNRGGDSCDILLGEDDFTVVESNGLSEKSQRFFFILFMNAVYESAIAQGSSGFYENSYETVIVLEEANSILIANGEEDSAGQASINRFNQILDKSASLGLFIWTITQKIASMPNSVIANSGLVFAGKTTAEKDQQVIIKTFGYDDRNADVQIKHFLPRMATGIFMCKVNKGMNFEDQTPFCIRSRMVKCSIPSDAELDVLIKEHELARDLAKEKGEE